MGRAGWPMFLLCSAAFTQAQSGSSLVVAATKTTVAKGTTATLSCSLVSPAGAKKPCASPIYSEDQSGFVIALSGAILTAYSIGAATVTAQANGLVGTVKVSVVPPSLEDLGAIPASQIVNGLGYNVTPENDWEFQQAVAGGATHVRFQCGWATAEKQTAPPLNSPANPRFALQDYCQSALRSAQKYNLHPTIVAAYGPPYHATLQVTVPNGAIAGSRTIQVQMSSGFGGDTLSSLRPFYDTVLKSNGSQIGNVHSYQGTLISAVSQDDATHATLTLGSALTADLPADQTTTYTINEMLYAPPASFAASDPSVSAFAEYAGFLAQSMAEKSLSGEVELWNEPTWPDDPWDDRSDFFDVFPGPASPGPQYPYLPNWGFAAALQNTPPSPGVTYLWGGTEKSGSNSLLDPQMQLNAGVSLNEPAQAVTSESFHPYGNTPEDALWSAPCLATTTGHNDFFHCNLFGLAGGNFSLAAQNTLLQQRKNAAYGVSHNITETGFSLLYGDAAHQARFAMRQFLGYQAAGVTPIEFYRLWDPTPGKLGFVNPATHQALPVFTALAGLISDARQIARAPISSYEASTLSQVTSYSGTYPLELVHLLGLRSGDTSNSEMLVVWQRSYPPPTTAWAGLAQPVAVTVKVAMPPRTTIASVVNLDTRAAIRYTISGGQVSFAVSDDPVAVLFVP